MHDVSRQPVEQVRVVDPDQHPALTGLHDERIDDPAHAGQRVGDRVAHRRAERPEWQWPRRLGADDPGRALTRRGGLGHDFTGKSRLAHAGGPDDHHAGVSPYSTQRPTDDREFGVPPRQRITTGHSREHNARK